MHKYPEGAIVIEPSDPAQGSVKIIGYGGLDTSCLEGLTHEMPRPARTHKKRKKRNKK